MIMKKLRLLVTKQCNRSCEGCCNKYWNLDSLPICTSFKEYDEVLLTGGEPALKPLVVLRTIQKIREQNPEAKIFIYSANIMSCTFTSITDGITYTLHEQSDVKDFLVVNDVIDKSKSNRLNIFKGITLPKDIDLSGWKVKDNMVWDKDCPLPENEVLMRL